MRFTARTVLGTSFDKFDADQSRMETRMLKSKLNLVTALMLVSGISAQAADLNSEQLRLIRESARDICDTVKDVKGTQTEAQIKGEVGAKIAGAIGKIVDLGGNIGGNLTRSDFEGLSRDATATALAGDRECRERIFNRMFSQLSPGSPPPPPPSPQTSKCEISYPNGTMIPSLFQGTSALPTDRECKNLDAGKRYKASFMGTLKAASTSGPALLQRAFFALDINPGNRLANENFTELQVRFEDRPPAASEPYLLKSENQNRYFIPAGRDNSIMLRIYKNGPTHCQTSVGQGDFCYLDGAKVVIEAVD